MKPENLKIKPENGRVIISYNGQPIRDLVGHYYCNLLCVKISWDKSDNQTVESWENFDESLFSELYKPTKDFIPKIKHVRKAKK